MAKKFILDACCGNREMWLNKKHPFVLYMDKFPRKKGHMETQKNHEVDPDIIADFTQMPFKDYSFKLVVFDPPHLKNLVETSIMKKKYGILNAETWPYDLKKGFKECWRVLENYGILIFKWNDHDISFEKVLNCFPERPLFGHLTKAGKHSSTKWFCFMKIPEGDK